jgi:hypothetical protein
MVHIFTRLDQYTESQQHKPYSLLVFPSQLHDSALRINDQMLPARIPRDSARRKRLLCQLVPFLGRLVVVDDGERSSTNDCQELRRVVPGDGSHGCAKVERLDLGLLTRLAQVPDADAGRAGRRRCQPRAVLRETQRLKRTFCFECCGDFASLDIEDFDFAVFAADGKDVAVRVELTACKFLFVSRSSIAHIA